MPHQGLFLICPIRPASLIILTQRPLQAHCWGDLRGATRTLDTVLLCSAVSVLSGRPHRRLPIAVCPREPGLGPPSGSQLHGVPRVLGGITPYLPTICLHTAENSALWYGRKQNKIN